MNTQTYEQPPSVAERADDELYANAVNALAAVFRFDIEDARSKRGNKHMAFAHVLESVGRSMRDTCDLSGAAFQRDVFEQHGPGAVLLALKRAYTEPQPDAPLVGD